MDKEALKRTIDILLEDYSKRMFSAERAPTDELRLWSKTRVADVSYQIFYHLRERGDSVAADWLSKMIEHYLDQEVREKKLMTKEGLWANLGALDHFLEAAIALDDLEILKNLDQWLGESYVVAERARDGYKFRMIEMAIALNRPEVAKRLLTDFDMTRGNVDKKTKTLYGNAPQIFEAILSGDHETFEKEVGEMKKRWKRSKEGRKYSYCPKEIIYRGLFDIYKKHEKK